MSEVLPSLISEITQLNHELKSFLSENGSKQSLKSLIDLENKTSDKALKIATMGLYNAGKSTLINALIGKEVAPIGARPKTESIDHYTLNQGVIILDTPGLDSNYLQHDRTAYEAIQSSNIVLFVISTKGSFEDNRQWRELAALTEDYGLPTAIVVNVKESEHLDEIMETIQKKIDRFCDGKNLIGLFVIDSLAAYEGIKNKEDDLIAKSGIRQLSTVLKNVWEKSKAPLAWIHFLNRALDIFNLEFPSQDDIEMERERIKWTSLDRLRAKLSYYRQNAYEKRDLLLMDFKTTCINQATLLKARVDELNQNTFMEGVYETENKLKEYLKNLYNQVFDTIHHISEDLKEDIQDMQTIDFPYDITQLRIDLSNLGELFKKSEERFNKTMETLDQIRSLDSFLSVNRNHPQLKTTSTSKDIISMERMDMMFTKMLDMSLNMLEYLEEEETKAQLKDELESVLFDIQEQLRAEAQSVTKSWLEEFFDNTTQALRATEKKMEDKLKTKQDLDNQVKWLKLKIKDRKSLIQQYI